MSPSVSTGRVRVGRFTMVVGEPAGTIVSVVEDAPPRPPPELVAALDAPPPAPAEELQEAVEDAGEVTSKVERAVELFTLVAQGKLDAAAVSKELDALLDLLARLDRAGRFEEVLRLARPLQALLALALRWVSLVEALRAALHAAEALASSEAIGWVRHELGSLGLGAEDAQAAEADLERARELREQRGDGTGLRATEHNLETLRLAFTGGGGGGRWSTRTLAIAGATVLALVILGFVLAPALDDGTDDDIATTTQTTATRTTPPPPPPPSPPPSDAVAPRVQITAPPDGVVVRSAEVAITGTAGDAPGDATTVQLIIRAGSSDGEEVLGPIDVARQGTDWSHTATLPLKAGTRMQYTAEATQRDEAGNTSQPETVTFTAYRPPPPPPTVTDPPPTVTEPPPPEPDVPG